MAKSFCSRPGCKEYTFGSSYCEKHKYKPEPVLDIKRPSAYQRGYNNQWFKFAAKELKARNYICEVCKQKAEVLGHWEMSGAEMLKINNGSFIYDSNLYKALCRSCNAKSKVYRGI